MTKEDEAKEKRRQANRRYYEANREKLLEQDRRRQRANRERVTQTLRRWRKANPEKVAEIARRQRETNPEKVAEAQRRWQEAHPGLGSERMRLWREANPEKARINKRVSAKNRRARKEGAEGSHTEAQWQALKSYYMDQCLDCGEVPDELTRDHVIPITKGGSNDIGNIQPLCRPCNNRKRANIIDYR